MAHTALVKKSVVRYSAEKLMQEVKEREALISQIKKEVATEWDNLTHPIEFSPGCDTAVPVYEME